MDLSVVSKLQANLHASQRQVERAPGDQQAQFDLARSQFLLAARTGDGQLLRKARAHFASARGDTAYGDLATAYEGACLLVESRIESNPFRKGELARDGLALLDQAVTADGASDETHFVRATSLARLPRFFGLHAQAVSELERLASKTEPDLTPSMRATIELQLGDAASAAGRKPDATNHWRRAAELGPGSAAAIEAGQRLAETAK